MIWIYLLMLESEEDCIKFDKIVDEYEGMMFRAAFSVIKDNYYAEEAMQSVLISIARNIKNIKTDNASMLKSYLYVTAENASIDILRRIERDSICSDIDEHTELASDDNLYDRVIGSEETKRIVKLLDRIPAIYRDVLILKLLHEHSLYMIAEELDRKYCTVRKQFVRGRKMLETLMRERKKND